jgi:hypothetical protein
MTSSAGAGTKKESAMTVEDLTKRFATMEELLRPLQLLTETVQKLSARVADQDQQQRALNLALLRLEHGDGAPPPPPPPPADGVPPPPRNQGTGSTNASVAGYTGPHRVSMRTTTAAISCQPTTSWTSPSSTGRTIRSSSSITVNNISVCVGHRSTSACRMPRSICSMTSSSGFIA